MKKIDEKDSFYYGLPPNMQDAFSYAYATALDNQMKKIHSMATKLKLWTNLNDVDPKYYDYIAASLKAPYYKSEYDNEKKLELIKTAILSNAYAGTQKGIMDFLNSMYSDAEYLAWYEYEGEPYHFKVRTNEEKTEESEKEFEKIIEKVKATRSVLDGIETVRRMETKLEFAQTADIVRNIFVGDNG